MRSEQFTQWIPQYLQKLQERLANHLEEEIPRFFSRLKPQKRPADTYVIHLYCTVTEKHWFKDKEYHQKLLTIHATPDYDNSTLILRVDDHNKPELKKHVQKLLYALSRKAPYPVQTQF